MNEYLGYERDLVYNYNMIRQTMKQIVCIYNAIRLFINKININVYSYKIKQGQTKSIPFLTE